MTLLQLKRRRASLDKKRLDHMRKQIKISAEMAKITKEIFQIEVIKKYGETITYNSKKYKLIHSWAIAPVKKDGTIGWRKTAHHLMDYLKGKSKSPFNMIEISE